MSERHHPMRVMCIDFYGETHHVDSSDLIERHSAYVVHINDGKVLMTQNPYSKRWELPGGGIEEGETTLQALERELIEETGVAPSGDEPLYLTEWMEHYFDAPTKKAYRSKREFYLVRTITNEERLLKDGNGDDSAAARFQPIATLSELHIAQAILEVVLVADTLL